MYIGEYSQRLHESVSNHQVHSLGQGMAMYPDNASSSYAQSLEPEIEQHFGFELWLAIGLFLFVAAMATADWLF
ncbi:MAG TPA: hypothetical protein VGJ26_19010 [Pirellulales bacterium]